MITHGMLLLVRDECHDRCLCGRNVLFGESRHLRLQATRVAFLRPRRWAVDSALITTDACPSALLHDLVTHPEG
jgi:hypothetical protein